MELKKNPKYDFESKRGMIFNLALIISLGLVFTAFEWKTQEQVFDIEPEDFDPVVLVDIEATVQKPPEKPKVVMPKIVEVPVDQEIKDMDYLIDNEFSDSTAIVEIVDMTPEPDEIIPDVFDIVETPAEPFGGHKTFYKFVSENLKYPKLARKTGVSGKVYIQFVVDKDGSLTNVTAVKKIGGGCDEEAVRVFNKAPKWKPGKQRGKPVKVRMVMPIVFDLN